MIYLIGIVIFIISLIGGYVMFIYGLDKSESSKSHQVMFWSFLAAFGALIMLSSLFIGLGACLLLNSFLIQ